MKQAAVAAIRGQVFSEVRGKYTARACESDMNTVYFTGVCVRTDFPLRPLSEPGCWASEGLMAWQTCLSSVVVISSRQLFGQTHTSSIKVSNLYSEKA